MWFPQSQYMYKLSPHSINAGTQHTQLLGYKLVWAELTESFVSFTARDRSWRLHLMGRMGSRRPNTLKHSIHLHSFQRECGCQNHSSCKLFFCASLTAKQIWMIKDKKELSLKNRFFFFCQVGKKHFLPKSHILLLQQAHNDSDVKPHRKISTS